MLYVFHVDTGTMMTFEMNLALESVQQLKESIERLCRISVEKQVLLVSGGECLDPAARVCSYSAGTDTNPIYLFSKSALENAKPPSPNFDCISDSDIKDLFDATLNMTPSYNTVAARAQLAQQFCELAREHTRVCEGLVHDQHLQQQGWAAAVANLEDITSAFKTKSEMFQQSYQQHLEVREESLKILQSFNKDLEVLSKIPILPQLMENALNFLNSDGTKKSHECEQTNSGQDEDEKRENSKVSTKVSGMTLLTWISTADDQSSLEQMAEQAQRGLEQLDEEVLKSLNSDVMAALDASNKSDMKEIKGLEERLFGLEQLMVETKKTVQVQSDLAQALVQNQNRAGILKDTSILPDLCASHRGQLVVMWENHLRLCDIRRRCFKAKEELSINLYHRLGWVMFVENLILNVTNKLMIYHENLKRLRRYVEITRQVQRAPQVYIAAVSEVVRRKNFSQAFLTWASDMSCRLLAVYNEEFEKRREFQSLFEGHFLQSLFPGFEDNPPSFATRAPAPFDVCLPKLTVGDLEQLKEYLPELAMSVSMTKLSTIAQMFLTKSISETKSSDSKENVPVEDRLVAAVSEIGLSSKLDETLLQPAEQEGERVKLPQHKDDRDFESETDTEEFEKVCQSPVDIAAPPGSKFDESCLSKSEVEILRSYLSTASKLANQTAYHLKAELVEMKNNSASDREAILMLVNDIQSHVSGITRGYLEENENLHARLNEIIDSGKRETDALNQVIKEKEELLKVLTQDLNKIRSILEDTESQKQDLSESLSTSQRLCQDLQMKLEDAAREKVKIIEEVTDQLAAEYENKIAFLEQRLEETKEEHDGEGTADAKALNKLKESFTKECNQKLEELKKQMTEEAQIERQRAIKEISEKLALEYKTEIGNIRSRYRLMSAANMQKSPSEASLEKIERLDAIELSNHEAIVFQLKEDAAFEKERAVKEAVYEEAEKWKLKLEEELKLGKLRMEEEKRIWLNEAIDRATSEKNNQIEQLLVRHDSMTTECQRLRDTIKFLTDGEQSLFGSSPRAGTIDPLLERIKTLETEKLALATELEREKCKPKAVDVMSTSVALMAEAESRCKDAATSPEPFAFSEASSKDRLTRSIIQHGEISVTSCSVGDVVLVVWDVEHSNYTIFQDNSNLYFLHSDCLDSLGLKSGSDGLSRRSYCTAQVTDKEFCYAKKPGNRYGVPKGTKFYRVRVRPLTRESKESRHHSSSSSQCEEFSNSFQHSPKSGRSSLYYSTENPFTSSQCTDREFDEKKES